MVRHFLPAGAKACLAALTVVRPAAMTPRVAATIRVSMSPAAPRTPTRRPTSSMQFERYARPSRHHVAGRRCAPPPPPWPTRCGGCARRGPRPRRAQRPSARRHRLRAELPSRKPAATLTSEGRVHTVAQDAIRGTDRGRCRASWRPRWGTGGCHRRPEDPCRWGPGSCRWVLIEGGSGDEPVSGRPPRGRPTAVGTGRRPAARAAQRTSRQSAPSRARASRITATCGRCLWARGARGWRGSPPRRHAGANC